MPTNHRNLVNHTFHGRRFDDGGVDPDVMPDLVRYKTLLVEVAKELWRRNHPDRKYLPKNFEDSLSTKFYEVVANCATIPLERVSTAADRELLWDTEDELDDAVTLVAETIDAAGNDQSLPEQFPKHLLVLFQDYGKTLRDDEWIEHRPPKRESGIRYDALVRERLTRWVESPYEDAVDLTGEVTMARVSNPLMTIKFDGRNIEAAFRPEDEDVITTALKQHTTAKLRVIGRGQFGTDGLVRKVTEVTEVCLLSTGERPFDSSAKPIWEVFEEILADIPDEQFAKLPVDGADRHDFYIHGSREIAQ